MSDKIDQRIVEMSFENAKFEKGIQQSKNSLKEFAQALKKSGSKNNFGGLEQSIGSVSKSFSMFEQIAIGGLRRIGEMATNTGIALFKSLSIDQLASGWAKYEQKTASVQTIMNATGKSIEEVNEYLDQLMWFSDETSYGFTDMTAALAQMTSSGGDIEKLIPLITGVANATAFAGKGAAEFSRVMYNLNQSYGSGNLQYMDWRSLELAGVAGEQLKQVFIDTSKALGILDKEGRTAKGTLVDIGTFGSTLQEKWANTEVMEKAFGKFSELSQAAYELVNEGAYDTAAQAMDALTGQYSEIAEKGFRAAQTAKSFSEAIDATKDAVSSGWLRTYEILFGTLEEAKENFTVLTEILYTVFAAGEEGRNEMLKGIKAAGGIKNIFQALKNVVIAIAKPLEALVKGFSEVFPPKTVAQWVEITKTFKSFTESLIISDETSKKLKKTFAGVFAVIDLVWQVVKLAGSAFLEIIKIFIPVGDSLLDVTATIGDFLVYINKAIKDSGFFQYALLAIKIAAVLLRNALATIIGKIATFINGLWNANDPLEFLGETAKKVFGGMLEKIKMVSNWISTTFMKALTTVRNFLNAKTGQDSFLSNLFLVFKNGIDFIIRVATGGLKAFGEIIKNLDFSKITTFVTGGILLIFVSQLAELTNKLSGLVGAFTTFTTKLSKKLFGTTTKIKDLALVITALAGSIWLLSTIEWNKLVVGLGGLAAALVIFIGAYAALQAIGRKNVGNKSILSGSMLELIGFATSVAILAFAIKSISSIDEASVVRSAFIISAMGGILIAWEAITTLVGKIPGSGKLDFKITGLALGVLALVGALKIINAVTVGEIKDSIDKLMRVVALIIGMQLALAVAARVANGGKLSTSLGSVAVGLLAMVGVLKILSKFDPNIITAAIPNLIKIGLLLSGIEILFGLAGRVGGGKKFRAHTFSISTGLVALVGLLAIIDTMHKNGYDIDRGVITLAKMAGILTAVELLTATASRIAGKNKPQKFIGALTFALLSFVGLIALIQNFEDSAIDRGIATILKMSGIMVAIEFLTAAASKIKGGGSFGLITGTIIAIVSLTSAIILLSTVDQTSLRAAVYSLTIASVAISAVLMALSVVSDTMSKTHVKDVKFGALKQLLPALGVMAITIGAVLGVMAIVGNNASVFEKVSVSTMVTFGIGLGMISYLVNAFDVLLNRGTSNASGMPSGLPKLSGSSSSIRTMGEQLKGIAPAFIAMGAAVLSTMVVFTALSAMSGIMARVDIGTITKFSIGLIAVSAVVLAFSVFYKGGLIPTQLGQQLMGLIPVFVALIGVIGATAGVFAILGAMNSTIMKVDIGTIKKFILVLGVMTGLIAAFAVLSPLFALLGAFPIFAISGVITAIASVGLIMAGFVGMAYVANKLVESKDDLQNGIDILVLIGEGIGRFAASFLSGAVIESLSAIGRGIADFSKSISEIKIQDTTGVKNLAESIGIISGSAVLSGMAKWINSGEDPVNIFCKQLNTLVNSLSWINTDAIDNATAVLKAMEPMMDSLGEIVVVAKDIPNTGGLAALWFGNNDIDDFGLRLMAFVNAFLWTSEESARKAVGVISNLVPMIDNFKLLTEAFKTIPNTGGLAALWFGNNDIDDFGRRMVSFINVFLWTSEEKVKNAITIIAMLAAIVPELNSFIGLTNTLPNNNSKIYGLGDAIQGFVGRLKNTKFEKSGEILDTFKAFSESFQTIGKAMVAVNNLVPINKTIASIFDEVINMFDGTSNSTSYVNRFKLLGKDLMVGLKEGIDGEHDTVVAAIAKVSKSIIKTSENTFEIQSPSKVFASIGGWCTKGLAYGITSNTKVAEEAAHKMGLDTEEAVRDALGVHSLSDIWVTIGQWLPTSLGKGVEWGKDGLLNIAKSLGLDTTGAVADGANSGTGEVKNVFTNLLGLLTGDSDITDVAKSLGISIGESVAEGTKEGVEGAKTLESLESLLETGKFYGQVSLEEELASYEALRKSANLTAEDIQKVDREIYTLRKQIYSAQTTYIADTEKAEQDASNKRKELLEDYKNDVAETQMDSDKKLADLRKKYDKNVESAKASSQKQELTKEKQYVDNIVKINEDAEKERQKTREDYAQKQADVNAQLLTDIDNLNQKYTDAVKARTDAIYGSYGLFEEVEKKIAGSGEQLLQNLRDQTASFGEWQQALDFLKGRGVSSAMLEEIQKMGPESTGQIKALLSLTDEQLTEYSALFENKYAFANSKAVSELEGLKESTAQAIQDLNTQAAADLNILELEFNTTMSAIDSGTFEKLKDLKNTFDLGMQEIKKELDIDLKDLKTEFNESEAEINQDLTDRLAEMKKTYNTSLTEISSDVATKLQSIKTTYWNTMKAMNDATSEQLAENITNNKTSFTALVTQTKEDIATFAETVVPLVKEVGKQIAEGLVEGIEGEEEVDTVGKHLSLKMERAARFLEHKMEIQSPSKVFARIGAFISLGLAKGITDYAYKVEEAGEQLANSPTAMISKALAEIGEDDPDWSPKITPVLDLSKIDPKQINDLLRTNNNYRLGSASTKLAVETIQNGNKSKPNSVDAPNGTGKPKETSYNFIQNNYSPKSLSRIDIYRQTKNQFSAMKAKVEGR